MAICRHIALMGVCAVAAACIDQSPSRPMSAGTPVTYAPFTPEFLSPSYSGPDDPIRGLLRTHAEWEVFWAQIEPRTSRLQGQDTPNPPPAVDFDRYAVIVAAMGTRPNGCCSVEITSVAETSKRVLVTVSEKTTGTGCMVTQAVTRPIALALIPKTTKHIEFEVITKVQQCG